MIKKNISTILIIIIVAGIFGSISLLYPYGRDQGIYGYVGSTILDGGHPYKDAWDFKPPGIFYIFALSSLLFGKSMMAIRIFEIFWQIGTALVVYGIVSKFYSRRLIGVIASTAYLFLFYTFGHWSIAQSESFISLPLALSAYFFLKAVDRLRYLYIFLSGFFIGLAVLLKYQFGLLLLIMAALLFMQKGFQEEGKKWTRLGVIKEKLFKTVVLLFGFSFPLLVTLIYYYLNDVLHDFIITEFVLTPKYVKLLFGSKSLLYYINQSGFHLYVYIALFLIIPFFLWHKKRLSTKVWLIIGWAGTCLLSILLQAKFFGYHYVPSIAPFLILALIALYPIIERKEKTQLIKSRILLYGAIFLTISGFMIIKYIPDMISVISVVLGKTTIEENYYDFGEYGIGDFSIQANMEVASFLKNNTIPNEKIYIWGFEPVIYLLADRRCVSRFIYNVPLYWEWSLPEYKEEFLDAVREENPKYFIVVRKDILYRVTGNFNDSQEAFEKFSVLKNFIDDEYKFDREIEHFTIYRLKS
jgi:4-amino-4-deoxy-L-arabinose transferase-like glycosyltransferase